MLQSIIKTASLVATLTVLTATYGDVAIAETENATNTCQQKAALSATENHIALSPNGDPSQCSDYYEKCDEYHCYECTVCTHGGPYCWEISENETEPEAKPFSLASK